MTNRNSKHSFFSLIFLLAVFILPFHLSAQQNFSEDSTSLKRSPRNIYLDLGAFQGDTLQMFNLNGVSSRCHSNIDWEVFAFEACPLLAHCTQLRVDALNNVSIDPPVSYSEIPNMQELVENVYKHNHPFGEELRLLFEKYEHLLISRISSQGPYKNLVTQTSETLKSRLSEAKDPLPSLGTKYTSYAMGVGAEDTILEMDWTFSNYINGGGNLLNIYYGTPNHIFYVPIIKLSRWIRESFTKEDFIYIKMDIEGMEFLLLDDLIKTGCLDFINEMDIEWHGRFNVPGRDREQELRKKITEAGILLRDHY